MLKGSRGWGCPSALMLSKLLVGCSSVRLNHLRTNSTAEQRCVANLGAL